MAPRRTFPLDHIPFLGRHPSLAGREMLWGLHFSHSTALRVTTQETRGRMILLLLQDSLLILGGIWLTCKCGAAWVVYDPLKWQQVLPSNDSCPSEHQQTEQQCVSVARKPTKDQQINTNKCRSSRFPTPPQELPDETTLGIK